MTVFLCMCKMPEPISNHTEWIPFSLFADRHGNWGATHMGKSAQRCFVYTGEYKASQTCGILYALCLIFQ